MKKINKMKIGDRVKLVNCGNGVYLKDGDIGQVLECGVQTYCTDGKTRIAHRICFNTNYSDILINHHDYQN